jgi:hypothetical protein
VSLPGMNFAARALAALIAATLPGVSAKAQQGVSSVARCGATEHLQKTSGANRWPSVRPVASCFRHPGAGGVAPILNGWRSSASVILVQNWRDEP